MRTINYALQYPDYTQENHGEISFEKAVGVFKAFPWDTHLRTYKERENAGEEPAPPNISFTDGTYNLMVWANSKHRYGVMVSVPVKKLLMTSQKTMEFAPVSEADVYKIIKAYFEANYEAIKNYK